MAEAVVLAQARKLPYPASALSLEALGETSPLLRLPRVQGAGQIDSTMPASEAPSILDRIAAVLVVRLALRAGAR